MSQLRVFGVLNHLGHQHDMLKLAEKYPVEFTYLDNNVRKWGRFHHRPKPKHLKWATHYEKGKYDLAILHVDQQHVTPHIGKGQLYNDLNEVIQDIPKIVINHGTPMYPEMYDEDIVINGGDFHLQNGEVHKVKGMKEKIGNNFMVVNSYEAVKRWGWGYPLIHGLDPTDFYDLPKEPKVVLSLSAGGLDTYYNRQLITYIKTHTREIVGLDVIHTSIEPYVMRDWQEYKELLGQSLIMITPFKDSPMPRARTEGMLSGCLILSSKYHNANEFIQTGVNGFIVPDNPLSYAEAISEIINHAYKDAVEIGQRGRETALKHFHIDRYHKDLWWLLNEVANGRRPEWDGKKLWEKTE